MRGSTPDWFDIAFLRALQDRAREKHAGKEEKKRLEVLRHARAQLVAARVVTPPDLAQLARALHVAGVRYVPLAMHGRLVMENGEICVEIDDKLLEFERVFAFAHELSHLIVEERQCLAEGLRMSKDHARIESLCDLCAREMLLPAAWLQERVEPNPSLEAIQPVASALRYDIGFVAARLIEVGHWNGKLIWWGRQNEALRATRVYPEVDASFLAFIELLDAEHSLIGASLLRNAAVAGTLRIKTSDGEFAYDAEAVPIREGMLTLIRYS